MKTLLRFPFVTAAVMLGGLFLAVGCPRREAAVPPPAADAAPVDEVLPDEGTSTGGLISAPALLSGRKEGGPNGSLPTDPAISGTNAPAVVTPAMAVYKDPSVEVVVADGFLLMGKGNLDGAIERFSEAIRREPTASRPWFALGTCLFMTGQNREAVKAMKQSVELNPEDHLPVNNLAWILATSADAEIRDPIEAVNLARRAILMAPGDYHTWSTLAEAYYAKGEFHNALKPAQQAMEMLFRLGGTEEQIKEQEIQLRRIQDAARVMDIIE